MIGPVPMPWPQGYVCRCSGIPHARGIARCKWAHRPRPRPAGTTPTVDDARALATWAHRGQRDKLGQPYIEHPAAVAAAVARHGPLAQMVAWLHDAVEDTPLTLDDLRADGYPPEVVAAVEAVTRRPGETYLEAVRRAVADPLGRPVKRADSRHNRARLRKLARYDPQTARRLRAKYATTLPLLEPWWRVALSRIGSRIRRGRSGRVPAGPGDW